MSRQLTSIICLGFALAISPSLLAEKGGKGKGPKNNKGNGKDASAAVAVYIRPGDIPVINRYYAPQSLPPGLQKKLARTGTLPPGWQKGYRAFPHELEAQLPPICGNCMRGYYGNYAVVFDKKTAIIYDVAQLVADIAR